MCVIESQVSDLRLQSPFKVNDFKVLYV